MMPDRSKTAFNSPIRRVCVTGGAGMIGHRLVGCLVSRGIEAAVLDDLSSGLPMPERATQAIRCDIRDEAALDRALSALQPDAIVHLAALHHIPTCETQRALCLDINVAGTERLLAAAEKAGVCRVVIASSGAVYAWSEEALGEDASRTEPRDNYALSKLCNEHQLRLWSERGDRWGRVARIFNVLAGDDPNAHLLPDMLKQLQVAPGETALLRLGNLLPRRDYLHADEVAEGLVAVLLDRRPDPFDVFNLCSGQEHSVAAVAEQLAACLGRSIRIEVDEARRRRSDRPSQLGDPSKTAQLLGWRAQLPLRLALERLVAERRPALRNQAPLSAGERGS
jgi:UDP-glucose 4-epimerase